MPARPSVLFVCLGNICRSPLAEGALRAEAARAGLEIEVDSAGTGGWHIGKPPDSRARETALRHGIDIGFHRGRRVTPGDFLRFTHIIALDGQNLADLERMRPADGIAEVRLLLDYVPGRAGQAVADPYYGGEREFEAAWRDVSAGAVELVRLFTDG